MWVMQRDAGLNVSSNCPDKLNQSVMFILNLLAPHQGVCTRLVPVRASPHAEGQQTLSQKHTCRKFNTWEQHEINCSETLFLDGCET